MKEVFRYLSLMIMALGVFLPLGAQNLDSLYNRLDEAIAATPQYIAAKEERIAALRQQMEQARDDESRYRTARSLYQEYMPFINDSAIVYLQTCIRLCEKMDRTSDAAECRSLLALQCSNTGMFDEAQAILQEVNVNVI
ncbi:MAG: transcriptional regulator, partial [Prevotella sp.]|nr:transcriptional regulator [Prevotella sp.]